MSTIPIVLAAALLFVVGLVGVVRALLRISRPDEVLVISGVKRSTLGHKRVGYRLQQGGRTFVVPLFNRVDRLDLSNMIIDIRVQGAYSKGGIPLDVEGIANVKIASTEPIIGNAIERFLGKSRHEIMAVARETLEGNLRGVLATLTPEEVNQDRIKFATSLLAEAGDDLRRLGIVLDTLKIQNVTDDRGYLDSIGRRQSADLQRRSRVAEAGSRAEAMERDASNFEEKEIKRIEAEIELAHATAAKQLVDAETLEAAYVAEQRAEVAALIAESTAELEVQKARLEQTRLKLKADVVEPAMAQRQALIEKARANAALTIEEAKATATALRRLNASFELAGDDAQRLFVAQKLTGLVGQVLSTVQSTQIDSVTVVDGELARGDGLSGKATIAAKVLQETTGLELGRLFGAEAPALTTG